MSTPELQEQRVPPAVQMASETCEPGWRSQPLDRSCNLAVSGAAWPRAVRPSACSSNFRLTRNQNGWAGLSTSHGKTHTAPPEQMPSDRQVRLERGPSCDDLGPPLLPLRHSPHPPLQVPLTFIPPD